MRLLYFCVIFFSASSLHVSAQQQTIEQLNTLAGDMLYQKELDYRLQAMESFDSVMLQFLEAGGTFEDIQDSLQYFAILESNDQQFQLITAQTFINEKQFKYLGYLYYADGRYEKLIDRSQEMIAPTLTVGNRENWFGALVYDIQPIQFGGEKHYLLFGYNASGNFNRQKIVDVLTFDQHGNAVLGKPVFPVEDRMVSRFILRYAAEAKLTLRYDDERNLIIYDHLIPARSRYDKEQLIFVPDGSYCAFKPVKSGFEWISKVFHQTLEEAPRDVPVLDQGLGIGKKKNG